MRSFIRRAVGAATLHASPDAIRPVPGRLFALARRMDGRAALAFAAAAAVLLAADPAWAQGAGAGNITTFLQNIVNIITGTAGKLIAVIAIALVGIAWMFGAASARTAGGVIVGVILVFSASWIVDQIVGT